MILGSLCKKKKKLVVGEKVEKKQSLNFFTSPLTFYRQFLTLLLNSTFFCHNFMSEFYRVNSVDFLTDYSFSQRNLCTILLLFFFYTFFTRENFSILSCVSFVRLSLYVFTWSERIDRYKRKVGG